MECSIKAGKIQAMKNYKRAHHFFYNFIIYSLTSLVTFFFFSYDHFSFPSIKINLLFSLIPNNINISFFSLDAKCLFIVANIIIIFILVEESKVARSSNSSPASDFYDEYISRIRTSTTCPHKVNIKNVIAKEKEDDDDDDDDGFKKSMKVEEKLKHGNIKNLYGIEEKKIKETRVCSSSEVWDESEIKQREKTKGEWRGSINIYIPKEELNKRAEAFIARVNKQRLLEAKLLDHISRG